jgi:TonB family protein
MRAAIITAGALLVVLASAARADDLSDPVWAKAPGFDAWVKAYPAQAAQAGLSGTAHLRCAATIDGLLEKCAILDEAPGGHGFGVAALSLTSGMELRPTSHSGRPIAGRNVIVPVKFTPELLQPHHVITNPDWLKKPNGDEMGQYWPARSQGQAGKVVIRCIVSNRGLMDKCEVEHEEPAGAGFGQASLDLTSSFLMRPMTEDGLPVGGAEVTIPVNWAENSAYANLSVATYRMLRTPPWAVTPTASEIADAYPKNAVGRVEYGHVVLRCGVTATGVLKNCDTFSEEPKGQGFGMAARTLAKKFRVLTDPSDAKFDDVLVNLPIDFRDPAHPAPAAEIYDPMWLRGVDPTQAARIFPEEAAKAGYKTGVGTVECGVAHSGELTDCTVVKEDPPGLGFGASALAVAKIMAMNPWTAEGTPVDGTKVRVPIRLNMAEDTPAPPPVKP